MEDVSGDVLIIGCGNVGTRLALRYLQQGRRVCALVRSNHRAAALSALGITVVKGDLDQAHSMQALAEILERASTCFYFVPPPGEGEGDPRVGNLLSVWDRQHHPGQLIYMGTSGVYGDTGGAWVTEQSPLQPQTDRARRRMLAEQAWREGAEHLGFALTLLRVGGIYGPDRLPEARLRRGLPVLREQECGYSNRIHVEDLLRICEACAAQPADGIRIYNVSDGRPGNMTEYFLAVADALGLPHPPQLSMAEAREQLSPAMLSYLGESRRMDSHKVWQELGLRPRYPDLASGLAFL